MTKLFFMSAGGSATGEHKAGKFTPFLSFLITAILPLCVYAGKAKNQSPEEVCKTVNQVSDLEQYAIFAEAPLKQALKDAKGLVEKGWCEYAMGRYTKFMSESSRDGRIFLAQKYLLAAEKHFAEAGELTGTGEVLVELAAIALHFKKHDEARNYLSEARKLIQQIGDNRIAGNIFFQLGELAQEHLRSEENNYYKRKALAAYERACSSEDLRACLLAARMYSDGMYGIARDSEESRIFAIQSIEAMKLPEYLGPRYLDNRQNQSMSEEERARAAYSILKKSCDLGNTIGCHFLAISGRQFERLLNLKISGFDLLESSCNSGEVASCNLLGEIFDFDMGSAYGVNVSGGHDQKRADYYHQKACDNGDVAQCNRLGQLYECTERYRESVRSAVSLYRKSCGFGDQQKCLRIEQLKRCVQNDVDACVWLGTNLDTSDGKTDTDGRYRADLFRSACDKENAEGCYWFGWLYFSGDNIVIKREDALNAFEKGCDLGHVDCCYQSGDLLLSDSTGNQPFKQAEQHFITACSRGHSEGCRRLSELHRDGAGVVMDETLASSFLEMSLQLDNVTAGEAVYALGIIQEHSSPEEAADSYGQACELKEYRGCVSLGRMYENGYGDSADLPRAMELYDKACVGGIDAACLAPCNTLSGTGKLHDSIQCYSDVIETAKSDRQSSLYCMAEAALGQEQAGAGNYSMAIVNLNEAIECALKIEKSPPPKETPAVIIPGRTEVATEKNFPAGAYHALATVNFSLGNYSEAFLNHQKALDLYEQVPNDYGRAKTYLGIGLVALSQNQVTEAREYLEHVIAIYRDKNDINSAYRVQLPLAEAIHRQGQKWLTDDYQKAIEYFTANGQLFQMAQVFDQLGRIGLAEGRFRGAVRFFDHAIAAFQNTGHRSMEMWARHNVGFALEKLGYIERAIAAFDMAAELADDLLNHAGEDETQKGLRRHLDDIYEAPIRLRHKKIEMLEKRGDHIGVGQNSEATFSLLEKRRARVMIQRIAEINIKGSGLSDELANEEVEINSGISSQLKKISGSTAHNFWEEDLPGDADTSQRSALIGTKKTTDSQSTIPDARLRELKVLYARRAAFSKKLWSNRDTVAYAALNYPRSLVPSQTELHDNEVLLEYMVGETAVYRWTLRKNELLEFTELKIAPDALGKEVTSLLNLVKAGKRPQQTAHSLYKILIADAMKYVPGENGRLIIIPDGVLATLPFEYLNQSAGSGPNDEKPLGLDYPIVYAPSARAIELARKGITGNNASYNRKLLAIGDPVYLPGFDQRCGIKLESSDSNYCPSTNMSADRELIEKSRKLGLFNGKTKLAALPIDRTGPSESMQTIESKVRGNDGFNRLCHTRNEVLEISQAFEKNASDVLLDFTPTRTHVMQLLQDNRYETIHFSTHGVIPEAGDNSRYAQPAIVLAAVPEKERTAKENAYIDRLVSNEQLLTMKDIFESRIPAKQVTLSACHSGQGEQIKGEGVQGMGQTFLYAGAQTVVMSLWSVNDASTAEWMKVYYFAIQNGKDRAEAALEARRAIHAKSGFRNNWSSPYYWAPFIVVGVER